MPAAVKANPDIAAPHRVLGESLIESGETSAAIQELQTAARQAPEFPQTHFLQAQVLSQAPGPEPQPRAELRGTHLIAYEPIVR
jgi:predicted Zn-dependent protease